MASGVHVDEQLQEEHRRKRLRKGTRSCWECKRRKIRCHFPEANSICRGCKERGTSCVSQEFEDDHEPSYGNQLGRRLGRVEQMLEKLVQHIGDEGSKAPQMSTPDVPDVLGIDVLTPTSSTPATAYDNAPIFSLFDNAVFKQKPDDKMPDDGHFPNLNAVAARPSPSLTNHASSKLDKLRHVLIALLPSGNDIKWLSLTSLGWWLIKKHFLDELSRGDVSIFHVVFNRDFPPDVHPSVVARLILCLALCIQQLPPRSRHERFQDNLPVAELEEKYMATVVSLVTSDDELIGSMDGLECLLLQGNYQLNAGNFRRAWLSFRRALNVGQLLGLHRFSKKTFKTRNSLVELRGKYLWYLTAKYRCIALILGLPSGTPSSTSFAEGLSEILVSPSEIYSAKLCEISSLILDRNDGDSARAFAATQEIDERLDKLAKTMSADWWEVPSPSLEITLLEAAESFDKLMAQIWHYQLEALLHLPFMYRAAQERRYEYSKISCLKASREIVRRWIYLMGMHGAPIVSKLVDFQAFTSCVILLLGLVSPRQGSTDPEQDRQEIEDRKLVKSVIHMPEARPTALSDKIYAQNIEVLKSLETVDIHKPCKLNGSIRLSIPHFGTITLVGGLCRTDKETMALRHVAASHVAEDNGNSQQQYTPPATAPAHATVGFESAIFQPVSMDQEDWQFSDVDVMLFDSLLDTSIEGKWGF